MHRFNTRPLFRVQVENVLALLLFVAAVCAAVWGAIELGEALRGMML